MANVHGFGDFNRNQTDERRAQRNQQEDNNDGNNANSMNDLFEDSNSYTPNILVACERLKVPFYSGARALKYPRDENFIDFFLYNMCPVIRLFSFTVAIILIDIAVFIASVSLGLNKQGSLLAVNANTLYWFQGVFAKSVWKGEFYRLICAIFLHANFIHIFGNLLVTLIILSRVEYTYGIIKTILIYLFTGIFGNLFSITVQSSYNSVSVGASTALFGLMGVLIGYFIINWSALQFMGRLRCSLFMNLVMMIIFSILISASVANVDNWGHFGGLLSGIWIAAIPSSHKKQKRQNIIRGVFVSLLIIQVLVCLLVFYLGKPQLKSEAQVWVGPPRPW